MKAAMIGRAVLWLLAVLVLLALLLLTGSLWLIGLIAVMILLPLFSLLWNRAAGKQVTVKVSLLERTRKHGEKSLRPLKSCSRWAECAAPSSW